MKYSFQCVLAIMLSILLVMGNPGLAAFADDVTPGLDGSVLNDEEELFSSDDLPEGLLLPGNCSEKTGEDFPAAEGEAANGSSGLAEGADENVPSALAEAADEDVPSIFAEAADENPETRGYIVTEEEAAGELTAGDSGTITLTTALLINSGNKSGYEGKTITGTVPASSYAGVIADAHFDGAVVVDGVALNLTIDGFNVDYSEETATLSGISLVNGATLHLTVKGENTLKGGFGGAGISVPAGCTLEITAASTGTLNAVGGRNFGGGAGIGSIGDGNNTQYYMLYPRSLGSIVINGGTINAQGGTWYMQHTAAAGAAGIGGSESGDGTGSITINGGTVTATGGRAAAGIGGGDTGTVQSITINGGTVTANGDEYGAAIGTGRNGYTSGSGTLTGPTIAISGGAVTANGNIGFGEARDASQNIGGSVQIGADAFVICTGSVLAEAVDCARKVRFDANGGTGTMAEAALQYGEPYILPACGFAPPDASQYFAAWSVNGNTAEPGQRIEASCDLLVKPLWDTYVTVSFEANGGSGSMSEVTVKKGWGYTLPVCGFTAPTEQYFKKWRVVSAGKERYLLPGQPLTLTEDAVAQPVWESYVHLTFDANGGEGSMETWRVEKGETIVLPLCGFEAADVGWIFAYWTVDEYPFPGYPGDTILVSEDTTLKANWMSSLSWEYSIVYCDRDFTIRETVTVANDVTLKIEAGKTLTVNGGISIADGCTLSVEGPGTLVVNGSDGVNGKNYGSRGNEPGEDGHTAVQGNMVIQGGSVVVNGGAGGRGGDGGYNSANFVPGEAGGNGGFGMEGTLVVNDGMVQICGGNGGNGGDGYIASNDPLYIYLNVRLLNGGNGGQGKAAIYGTLTVNGGTVTASTGRGGDGGFRGSTPFDNEILTGENGADGGVSAAIDGTLNVNGGSVTAWGWPGVTGTFTYCGTETNAYYNGSLSYTVPSWTVTYDGNSAGAATGEMSAQSMPNGTPLALRPNAFRREGYAFAGWNTLPDGEGTAYADEESVALNEDVILYAQWIKNPHTFSFAPCENGGADGYLTMEDGQMTARLTLSPAVGYRVERVSYAYVGPDGETAEVSVDTVYNGKDYTASFHVPDADVEVTAAYAKGYTVIFDKNAADARGEMLHQVMFYGKDGTLRANEYIRRGYTFTCWTTAADGSGQSYADQAVTSPVTEPSVRVITLYAQWTPNRNTVSYEANGGSGDMQAVQVTTGEAYSLPACGFEPPEGMTFANWTIGGEAEAYFPGNGYQVLEDLVFRANWVFASWSGDVTVRDNNPTVNESILVSGDVTLTVEKGCTLTVNKTIDIQEGGSLTITGEGTLIVHGENGNDGYRKGRSPVDATSGLPAIRGVVIVLGGEITITGGAGGKGLDADPRDLRGSVSEVTGGHGGDGSAGIDGSLTVYGGHVSVCGGAGGIGGMTYAGTKNSYQSWPAASGTDGRAVTGEVTYSSAAEAAARQSGTGEWDAWSDLESGSSSELRFVLCTVPLPVVTFDANADSGVEGAMAPQAFCYNTAQSLAAVAYTREYYIFKCWNSKADGSGTAYSDGQSIVVTEDTTLYAQWVPDPAHFSVNDAGTEYTIHTAEGWGVFCDCLNNNAAYNRFSGKTVKLDASITVTRMAGSDSHDFCGTFDGNGKTITIDSSNGACAVFSHVSTTKADPDDAEDSPSAIRNLCVTGTINTSVKYAAGLISRMWGNVSIENCVSSVTINSGVSGDGTHGGFVAASNGNVTITGCVFDGKLLTTGGTTCCGGFVGWGGATVTNSLYAPAAIGSGETEVQAGTPYPSATFVRNGSAGDNCYYTRVLGTAQGKQPLTVAADEYVTVSAVSPIGDATATYNVSGITAYANGITRGGTFYYGSGDDVSLTLSHSDRTGYAFTGYTAGAGTLAGSENPYTLTMPAADVTVTAVWAEAEPAFKTKTLLLSGQIGVNFFVDLSMLEDTDREQVTMEFSVGGRTSTDTFDPNCTNPSTHQYYGFTCYINSAQMSETITATLHYGDDQTVTASTSVKEYVAYLVAHPEGFSDAAIALVKAIADYGHYMTPFVRANGTGVDADTTIESYHAYSADQINAAKTAFAERAISKTDANGILAGTTYKLALGSETTLYFYFRATEGTTISGTEQITVKNADGSPVGKAAVSFDGSRYCVRIPNINAAQLADRFTVTVTDSNDNPATITASALSYANTLLTSEAYKDDSVSVNAMAALYYYYVAARNYIYS